MTRLRAGLVGMGMMGRNHARVLASLEGVDLIGVADPALQGAGPGGAVGVSDLEELLALGLDYVVIAAPTAMHAELAAQCAEASVAVLVEKPLTVDLGQALALARLFAASDLVCAVGHIERYNPALQQAKKQLANGDLGEVYQISTRRQGPFPGRISDVGVILDLATHDFDLTAWVADDTYHSISARTAHRSGRPHEDLVAATAVLTRGTVTNHLVNWLSPAKERLTVITGDKGALVADTLSADLTYYENGLVRTQWSEVARFRGVAEGNITRLAIPKPEPLVVEHEQFRNAVLGLPADVVTFEQAARTVAVATACATSAPTGQSVTIEELL